MMRIVATLGLLLAAWAGWLLALSSSDLVGTASSGLVLFWNAFGSSIAHWC